jgi:hypothetical protein
MRVDAYFTGAQQLALKDQGKFLYIRGVNFIALYGCELCGGKFITVLPETIPR